MTAHLTETELVDFVDGTLDESRAAHLEGCVRCRENADSLRETIRRLDCADMPEPPSHFWSQFSARVGEQITGGPPGPDLWWRHVAAAAACAAGIAVFMVAGTRRLDDSARLPGPPATTNGIERWPAAAPAGVDASWPSNDAAWTLLRDAASELPSDEVSAAGFDLHPGSIDMAVSELTPAERAELERLLRNELKRSGA